MINSANRKNINDYFNSKKTRQSYKIGLEINRELADKSSWAVEDIAARTTSMVDEILEIYKL